MASRRCRRLAGCHRTGVGPSMCGAGNNGPPPALPIQAGPSLASIAMNRRLHPRRFRFRAAARTDRAAPGGRAQRLAPAGRPRPLPVDRVFRELPALLQPGDLLVFNDTRVIKARLWAKAPAAGRWALVERVLPNHEVLAHLRASKSPAGQPGCALPRPSMPGAGPRRAGRRSVPPALPGRPFALMGRHGHVPLPPYITHADGAEDDGRYQTGVRRRPGAVAAPTASLHFDAACCGRWTHAACRAAAVTLHVGAGTFQPVRAETIEAHRMHSEWFEWCRHGAGHRRHARCRRPRRRGGHDHAARAGVGRATAAARRRGGPTSSSRRASRSASSTCWSPTSTCRRARC